ncbi:helix-turn-helix domain-containing protein [Salmonella enterica subsp. enterica serovar Corvallis]|nr:helix-turn-helix domain-containing protein [Salmonella enterica subsp. enterica serovar Chailey]EHO4299350.1 helix-turn-helix domain-containing protein [Salmonella enterica]EIC6026420.1 helix-turn-helix domain-containing protein [Salmonella enterica subsp. enterica serovar Corvallis]
MTAHAAEFFTLDEVNRLKIIQDVVDRRLTTQMASQRLGISDRQCRRLLSRYRESGPLGMANRRRGKPSNNQLPDGLAQLETDDDLAAFFTWREPRRVSKSLTVQYDKVLYLIEDSELSRRAIGKYIEVWHYPDGRKELRLNGVILPYSIYDRLQEIDQGAIVDNKRLGRTLDFIKLVQGKRDNNRSQAIPAGDGPSRRRRKPTGKKSQRSLNGDDMLEALNTLQSRSEEIFGKRK